MDIENIKKILIDAESPPGASKRLMALTVAMQIYLSKRYDESGTDLQQMLDEVLKTIRWFVEVVDFAWEENPYYNSVAKVELTSMWERQVIHIAPYIAGAVRVLDKFGKLHGVDYDELMLAFESEQGNLFKRPDRIDISFIPVPDVLKLKIENEIFELAEEMVK